jgi:nitrogen regulatory protein P-II 1
VQEIRAYVKEERLDAVAHALRNVEGLTGMSAVRVEGFGRIRRPGERHAVADDLELLAAHVRVDVVCRDDLVERVVDAILAHAWAGLRGDGKIYVSSIEDAIRIASGERGEAAV